MAERTTIRLVLETKGDEMMLLWPSGRVQFVGFWQLLKFLWWAIRNDVRIVFDDDGSELT